jgi:hypothetical protein
MLEGELDVAVEVDFRPVHLTVLPSQISTKARAASTPCRRHSNSNETALVML